MTIETLSYTLTDKRLIDGIVSVVNRQNVGRTAEEWVTPEQFWNEKVTELANRFANDEKIGVITSASFVGRFTPAEYASIIAASQSDEQVAALVGLVMGNPYITLSDPRMMPALNQLEEAGLIEVGRKEQIVAYERPEPTEPPVLEENEMVTEPDAAMVEEEDPE